MIFLFKMCMKCCNTILKMVAMNMNVAISAIENENYSCCMLDVDFLAFPLRPEPISFKFVGALHVSSIYNPMIANDINVNLVNIICILRFNAHI